MGKLLSSKMQSYIVLSHSSVLQVFINPSRPINRQKGRQTVTYTHQTRSRNSRAVPKTNRRGQCVPAKTCVAELNVIKLRRRLTVVKFKRTFKFVQVNLKDGQTA